MPRSLTCEEREDFCGSLKEDETSVWFSGGREKRWRGAGRIGQHAIPESPRIDGRPLTDRIVLWIGARGR